MNRVQPPTEHPCDITVGGPGEANLTAQPSIPIFASPQREHWPFVRWQRVSQQTHQESVVGKLVPNVMAPLNPVDRELLDEIRGRGRATQEGEGVRLPCAVSSDFSKLINGHKKE